MDALESSSLQRIEPRAASSGWRLGTPGHLTIAVLLALAAVFLHAMFDARAPGLVYAPGAMDEAVYVQSGYDFASDFHDGHPGSILQDRSIAEHPVFTRLLYAGAILTDWAIRGYAPLPVKEQNRDYQLDFHASPGFMRYLEDARVVSSTCGIALVVLLALYSPLAGLFALLSTIVLTYTTRAYLEAPGMLCATVAVIVYARAKERECGPSWQTLVVTGVAVGLATAGKYYYGIAGVAIAVDMLLLTPGPVGRRLIKVALVAGTALVAFSVADLPFYTQGIARSVDLLRQHGLEYHSGWWLTASILHRQWYSEISMLSKGFRGWYPSDHQPFLIWIDPLIMALALLGLVTAYWRHTAITLWLLATMSFLIFYPVKYEQYTSLAIVPICLFAAFGVEFLWSNMLNSMPNFFGKDYSKSTTFR